jgi:hypothetical protein
LNDVGQGKRYLCKIGSFSLRRKETRRAGRAYAKATGGSALVKRVASLNHPGGASLKLLSLIERKGLEALL